MNLEKLIILDRDGVIIEDGDYNFTPSEVKLIPGVADAIATLHENGFYIVVVTNQRGIALQKGTIRNFWACNEMMRDLLKTENPKALLPDIRFSPHDNDATAFRKPYTDLIDNMKEFIDLKNSYAIGDRESDLQLGVNYGIDASNCFWVQTGKKNPPADIYPKFLNLTDAVGFIIKQ
jgi:histidinol-phosphate phosphatase family protein